MSDLKKIITEVISPGLLLLPKKMDTPQARVYLLASGLQESRFVYTHQVGGPAHGYWQFEQGGGTRGVLTHASTRAYAQAVCDARGIAPVLSLVFDKIETDQVFACAFARLLMWTDPPPLPVIGNEEGAWKMYVRVWRPGAVQRDYANLRAKWGRNYARAVSEISGK